MRANSNRKPQNNKMQRTKLGQNGASPLILVLGVPHEDPPSCRAWPSATAAPATARRDRMGYAEA